MSDADDKAMLDAAKIQIEGNTARLVLVMSGDGQPTSIKAVKASPDRTASRHGGEDDAGRNGPAGVVRFASTLSTIDKLNALVRLFPSLARKNPPRIDYGPGVKHFVKWAKGNCMSHGEILAARFIVQVWSGGNRCGLKGFDLFEAMSVWDDAHRSAFMVWVKDPFWT